jgi:hypothetical protein
MNLPGTSELFRPTRAVSPAVEPVAQPAAVEAPPPPPTNPNLKQKFRA